MQLFQINADDLATLEAAIPKIADRLTCAPELLDNKTRVQMRQVQQILSNVRWNYGPPVEIEHLPASD